MSGPYIIKVYRNGPTQVERVVHTPRPVALTGVQLSCWLPLVIPLLDGCRESSRCSRDTYPELHITKFTSIRKSKLAFPPAEGEEEVAVALEHGSALVMAGDVQVLPRPTRTATLHTSGTHIHFTEIRRRRKQRKQNATECQHERPTRKTESR